MHKLIELTQVTLKLCYNWRNIRVAPPSTIGGLDHYPVIMKVACSTEGTLVKRQTRPFRECHLAPVPGSHLISSSLFKIATKDRTPNLADPIRKGMYVRGRIGPGFCEV
jgi:hypothetical protein